MGKPPPFQPFDQIKSFILAPRQQAIECNDSTKPNIKISKSQINHISTKAINNRMHNRTKPNIIITKSPIKKYQKLATKTHTKLVG